MIEDSDKRDIAWLYPSELTEVMLSSGLPKYRAGQLFSWLHKKHVRDFSRMTDIPAPLRDELSRSWYITKADMIDVLVSKLDGTRKYVFAMSDGNVIESVFMRYHHGNSVCISSQAGCRMGCTFCASTIGGCARNLTASEMLAQIYMIEDDTGERVSNIVIMGSGEPLDNFDELIRFLRLINDPSGLNISMRNITVSTCGIPERIKDLAGYGLGITLALSLHAPSQEKRERIMPVARKYRLPEVLSACRYYASMTGRRLTFEYALVKGENDSEEDARKLASLIGSLHGHVNLIPVNPVVERDFKSPSAADVEHFRALLESMHINATVRRELGRDISSACGQLRRRYLKDAGLRTD